MWFSSFSSVFWNWVSVSMEMFSQKIKHQMLRQMGSGAGIRWCSQRLPLSQETNCSSGIWSKRESLVEDKSEHTPKIHDLDSWNFTFHLNLLWVVMLSFIWEHPAYHPHKHSSAAVISTISADSHFGSVLGYVLMKWSSHDQVEAPVPWDGSSVCTLSPASACGPLQETSAL